MSRRQADAEEDALSLSFLDVLCCGLGATIYLFLLFSILPHLGSGREGGDKTPAASRGAAGALDEEGDRVLIAPVLIQVSFPSTLDLGPADLEWDGLPEGKTIESVIARSAKTPCTAIAMAPEGFNPAKYGGRGKVALSLSREAMTQIATQPLSIRVHVGGGRQDLEAKVPTPMPGEKRTRVLEFDFLDPNKQWIHPLSK